MKKLKLKIGDTVEVIAGNHKGESGRILRFNKGKDRVFIDGVNLIKKHQKVDANNPNGGIIEKEGSVHFSNVMLVDPSKGEKTRVGRKANDEGKLQRYSKKTGEFIS